MAKKQASSGGTLIASPRLRIVTATESAMPAQKKLFGPLEDHLGRVATDLRISLTDKCNLRCQYCMPAEGLDWLPQQQILTTDEVVRLARIGIEHLGISEIRFTGGEPLLRRELAQIIAQIHAAHPHIPLSLTTNGMGLDKKAERLVSAGLSRINVSLDSICPETFAKLTRRNRLKDVLAGIDAAAEAGLFPIKINAVLMPGVNDTEAPTLLSWALEKNYQLRFIEQMPLDADQRWSKETTITAARMRQLLSGHFSLHRKTAPRGSAPAELFDVYPAGTKDFNKTVALGQVGIIASVTEPFCSSCTRTRITADGRVRSCLFSQTETDLLGLLRARTSDTQIAQHWRQAMWNKPAAHGQDSTGFTPQDFAQSSRSMSAIGG